MQKSLKINPPINRNANQRGINDIHLRWNCEHPLANDLNIVILPQHWHSRSVSASGTVDGSKQIGRCGPTFVNVMRRYLKMAFRPLHDRVLVRRVDSDEKTAGGIIIPDTAKEKPQEGEIVSAGAGAKSEDGKVTPLDVKSGDRVLFGKWSGTEVKVDGEDLLIMKESDILGIIE